MADADESLESLLRRVIIRVEGAVASEARLQALLEAVTLVAANLDVDETLRRIVSAAADLANAKYVALGVLDAEGAGLAKFVTHGLTQEEIRRIGPHPAGHGVLGLLVSDPRPLRLHDLSAHPRSYGFPPHHPPMRTFLGVPLTVGDRVFGSVYLSEKHDGSDFSPEDEKAVVALAAAAGVAVENARLFETVRRREQWLDATLQIQQAILRQVELDSALELVIKEARQVLRADVAMVVLESDAGTLEVRAIDGEPVAMLSQTLPREGVIAEVIDNAATVRLAGDPRVLGLDSVGSALLVPFTGPGGAGGALMVGTQSSSGGRWLAEDDVQALQGFAGQTAIALDRAQAQEDREALAVLADRDRIARDLHDVVLQRLFATGLRVQSAVRRVTDKDVVERLESAVQDLDATIRDIRMTIFELSRNASSGSLRSQLRDLAKAAREMLGLSPELVLEGPIDAVVPDSVGSDLLAVITEALTNVARHADATAVQVRVALEQVDDRPVLVATISDDGKGFAVPHHERGLRNMRQRAEAHAGWCAIDSAPGDGTVVDWRVPVDEPPAAA